MCRKRFFAYLLAILTPSYGCSEENPLVGVWRSDKEQTLRLIESSQVLSQEAKKILTEDVPFGKMVLEFGENTLKSTYDGETIVTAYRVKNRRGEVLEIEEKDAENGKWVKRRIELGEGAIIVPSVVSPHIREVFKRLERANT